MDGAVAYGYLREVGSDLFVLDEVLSIAIDMNAYDRYSSFPDYEFNTEKSGRSTSLLEQVKSWTEVDEYALPGHGFPVV